MGKNKSVLDKENKVLHLNRVMLLEKLFFFSYKVAKHGWSFVVNQ